MRKYLYKDIVLFLHWGTWQANYGKQFALHRACCRTKADAYAIAKAEVDYLNAKANEE